jgi:hypothetical protein
MYYLYSIQAWRDDAPEVGKFKSEQEAWNKAREIVEKTPHLEAPHLSIECLTRSSFVVAHDPDYQGGCPAYPRS